MTKNAVSLHCTVRRNATSRSEALAQPTAKSARDTQLLRACLLSHRARPRTPHRAVSRFTQQRALADAKVIRGGIPRKNLLQNKKEI